jgi:DNA adenine methylase
VRLRLAHGRPELRDGDDGRPRLNLLRIEEELSQAHLRLARTYVERLPWAECVERYDRPHTLFYMDPPYWGTEGYGVPFELEEYGGMAEAMRR